ADAEQLEHRRLELRIVDTDRAAADLVAVQHDVVRARDGLARRGAQGGGGSLARRRERVMQRRPAAGGRRFEQWEVDDPERRPLAFQKLTVAAERDPKRVQRFVDDARFVRAEEHEVAVNGLGTLEHAGDRRIGQELEDRRLQAVAALRPLVDLDVRETFRAVPADERGVVVDLFARELAAFRELERCDAALRVRRRAREYLELDAAEQIRDLDELERVAKIGLVAAVPP